MIRPELVFSDLPGEDRQGVLRAIADRVAAAGFAAEPQRLYRKLVEREELGSTCVEPGVAIPHCKVEGLDEVVISVGVCPEGAEFGGEDDDPVRLFFTLISPADNPAAHLQSLALISRWIQANSHVESLLKLTDSDAIYEFLQTSRSEEA